MIAIEKELKQFAKEDYSFYVEYAHHGKYVPARHHFLICEKLMQIERGELKRLMIFMPPRHGKSQTVTESFPSWYLGRNPSRRVITVSYGDQLARTFGRKNRQKLEEFGKDIFGVELAPDNQSVNNWGLKDHVGGMLSVGILSSITGFGASLLIIDDPLRNREQANSKIIRDKIYDEYRSSLITRLTSGGAVILILTRWHEDDLAGRILQEEPNKWEVLSLPAEAEEDDLLGRKVGEPLWQEFGFDKAWIEKTKIAVGSMAWASLFQQRPAPADGNMVKRDWFKFYEALPQLEETIISLDASFKDGDDNDYCVFQVWGRSGANKFLIDQVRDKMGFPATVQTFKSLTAKYPKATAKLVEDKANGTAVIQTLKNQISGIVAVNPEGGKISRLQAVSPQIEAGNVYLPSPSIAPWVHDYVEEFVVFPQGKNDDQVDCSTQALNHFENRQLIFIGRA